MVVEKQASFLGAYMGAFLNLLKIKQIKSITIESRHSHQIAKSTRLSTGFFVPEISAKPN